MLRCDGWIVWGWGFWDEDCDLEEGVERVVVVGWGWCDGGFEL